MKPPAWERLLFRHQRKNVGWAGEIYDLAPSEKSTSIDIRSRCNTARLLVRAGRATGRFDSGRRLMIVGSGPAAIAAALEAARHGIASYVVERRRTIAEQFAKCKCRYVHPNIYQWPQPIAERNDTGSEGDPYSLYWEAGPVADACRQWRLSWAGIRHSRDQIGLTRFVSYTEVSFATMEEVFRKINPDLEGAEIGMILFCGGFTETRDCVGQPDSAPFWGNDCVSEPYLGGTARKQTICVSGGGDGGIQDFLRCVSTHNILEMKDWWKTHRDSPTRTQWEKLEAACLTELRGKGYYRRKNPKIDLSAILRDNVEKYFVIKCGDLRDFGLFALDREREIRACTLLTRGPKINKAYPLNIVFLLMLIGAAARNQLNIKFNHLTLRVIPLPDRRKRIVFTTRKKPIVADMLIVRHGVKPHQMS